MTHARARAVIAGLAFALIGVVLLAVAGAMQGWELTLATLIAGVGAFLIASVAIAFVFEQWQLSALLEDLQARLKITEQIKRSGLSGFWLYFQDVPWDDLFEKSRHIDILFAYADRWRQDHRHRLVALLRKHGSRLRVVLPDPEAADVMTALAAQFQTPREELVQKIGDARLYFEALAVGAVGTVEVYYMTKAPAFTFYRFEANAIFTSYRHQAGRGNILSLQAERGGELYNWLQDEWYAVTREGLTAGTSRRVFPLEA